MADDDPGIVAFRETVLQAEGHRRVTAADGPGALQRVAECRPDLIALELDMPGRAGTRCAAV